jgi:hypothetical protein
MAAGLLMAAGRGHDRNKGTSTRIHSTHKRHGDFPISHETHLLLMDGGEE